MALVFASAAPPHPSTIHPCLISSTIKKICFLFWYVTRNTHSLFFSSCYRPDSMILYDTRFPLHTPPPLYHLTPNPVQGFHFPSMEYFYISSIPLPPQCCLFLPIPRPLLKRESDCRRRPRTDRTCKGKGELSLPSYSNSCSFPDSYAIPASNMIFRNFSANARKHTSAIYIIFCSMSSRSRAA